MDFKIVGRAYIRGRIVDEATVGVDGERISYVAVGSEGGKRILLGSDQILLPAATDLHVHLRDWEQSYKEDVSTGTAAAIAGGITTVAEMPNTIPPIDSVERFLERLRLLEEKSLADFAIHVMAIDDVKEVHELKKLGACGMKVYSERIHKIQEYLNVSRASGLRLVVHAEIDGDEPRAVELVLSKMREGDDVRFAHISRAKSIDMLRRARAYLKDCIKIEVTPHHLLMYEGALDERLRMISSVRPSLAERKDCEALYDALRDCTIDFIASDHAPHTIDEKLKDPPAPGFPSLEIIYPLMLTEWLEGRVDIDTVIRKMCIAPSNYLNIKKGSIDVGHYADLVVFNIKVKYAIDPERFLSKAKYTIFEGKQLLAKVSHVFRRGEHVFDGEIRVKAGGVHVKNLMVNTQEDNLYP